MLGLKLRLVATQGVGQVQKGRILQVERFARGLLPFPRAVVRGKNTNPNSSHAQKTVLIISVSL